MRISTEALRWSFEKYLGVEAPFPFSTGDIHKNVVNKFLYKYDHLNKDEAKKERTAAQITSVIIDLALKYDKDYDSHFGGDV